MHIHNKMKSVFLIFDSWDVYRKDTQKLDVAENFAYF